MLNIGIIGLGPEWESQYRPALARLSRRLRVTAVFDPVVSRAERAALDLGARCVLSMRAVLKRKDVRAVLLLDDSWHGLAPLRFAVESTKPLYIAGRLSHPLEQLEALSQAATAQGLVVCSELRMRATPATARVMELTATQLGQARDSDFSISSRLPEVSPLVVELIDAAAVVLRSLPSAVRIISTEPGLVRLAVEFRRSDPTGKPATLRIGLRYDATTSWLNFNTLCRYGVVEQTGDAQLRWRLIDGPPVDEVLDRERPAIEVLLDHFARRVVGGLVPIPGLDDACRILRLLEPHRDAIALFGKSPPSA